MVGGFWLIPWEARGQDACDYMPSGFDKSPRPTPGVQFRGDGTVAECIGFYGRAQILIDIHGDSLSAQRLYQEASGGTTQTFRVGCFRVRGDWEVAEADFTQAALASLQQRLTGTPCPGEAVTPPPPPGEGMSLGLACDANAVDVSGRVACNAAVSNAPEGAQLVYSWTVDGTGHGETGAELTLENLEVGSHSVSVSARDAATDVTLPQQTVSFTRLGAGPGGAVGGSGGGGGLRIPLVAGAAIAITLALGGLALRTRKPRAQPAAGAPGRVQYTPPQPAPPKAPRTPAPPPQSWPTPGPPKPPARGGAPRAGPTTAPTRPRPPGPEAAPTRARPPGPEAAPAAKRRRPTEAPEDAPQRKDRDRPPPTLSAQLLIRPSVLIERLYNTHTPRVLGDGVDFFFAGFVYQVGSPEEWEVDPAFPVVATWKVEGGTAELVDHCTWLKQPIGEFNLADRYANRTDAHNVAVRTSWHDKKGELKIGVKLDMHVRSIDRTTHWPDPLSYSTPLQAVPVVGANPKASLTANTERRIQRGLPSGEQGNITASADGIEKVYVEPVLELFEQPYAGGLNIDPGAIDPEVSAKTGGPQLLLSHFFDISRDVPKMTVDGKEYDDTSQLSKRQQALVLTCRFRFADRVLRRQGDRGCPVTFAFHPTGDALGLDGGGDRFDYVLTAHYAACGERYKARGMPQPAPVFVSLVPSKIAIEPDPLADLPHPTATTGATAGGGSGDPDAGYRTVVRARVRSSSGDHVPGSKVKPHRPSGDDDVLAAVNSWELVFRYDPPQKEPLSRWDRAYAGKSEHTMLVHDVDEEGYLLVAPGGGRAVTRDVEYDHWKEFFNPSERYLVGQCSTMRMLLRADKEELEGSHFYVGPPCKIYVYVGWRAASVFGHPFLGLINEHGQEFRVGFYPHLAFTGVIPWEAQGVAVGGVGGVVGAKAGAWFAGEVALFLASFFPGVATARVAVQVVRWGGTIVGAAAGFGSTGTTVGTTGVGILVDEGTSHPKSAGSTEMDPPTRFDACRGWDISVSEYRQVLSRLKEWKRRSDTEGLLYSVVAGLVRSDKSPFAGNCVTFTVDNCAALGIRVPFSADASVDRPVNYGEAVARDPRCEDNPMPGYGESFPGHPWDYRKAKRVPNMLQIDQTLGLTQPSAAPPAPQPVSGATQGGTPAVPYVIVPGGSP
jgi:hypothetical protein